MDCKLPISDNDLNTVSQILWQLHMVLVLFIIYSPPHTPPLSSSRERVNPFAQLYLYLFVCLFSYSNIHIYPVNLSGDLFVHTFYKALLNVSKLGSSDLFLR